MPRIYSSTLTITQPNSSSAMSVQKYGFTRGKKVIHLFILLSYLFHCLFSFSDLTFFSLLFPIIPLPLSSSDKVQGKPDVSDLNPRINSCPHPFYSPSTPFYSPSLTVFSQSKKEPFINSCLFIFS